MNSLDLKIFLYICIGAKINHTNVWALPYIDNFSKHAAPQRLDFGCITAQRVFGALNEILTFVQNLFREIIFKWILLPTKEFQESNLKIMPADDVIIYCLFMFWLGIQSYDADPGMYFSQFEFKIQYLIKTLSFFQVLEIIKGDWKSSI